MSKLYEEIAATLADSIRNKEFGTIKLPTERELCIKYAVSRQTIRKALEKCEEYGLIEKRQGSGIYLSSAFQKSVNKCAIIVPDKEEYIYPDIISDLEKILLGINFSLSIYESHDSNTEEAAILKFLIDNPVSNIIVISSRNNLPTPNEVLYNSLTTKKTNVIFIGNPYPNITNCSYIKFDDFYSGYSVAKRIKSTEKNWCAIFVLDDRGCIDRYYGFTQCMADNEYSYNENNIYWITHKDLMEIRYNNNSQCIKEILDTYTNTPSVIICGQDEIAYSTITHLKNTRKISEDISVFSFIRSYMSSLCDFPIHIYDGEKSLMYSKIVELLLSERKKEKEVITLPSSLIY